MIKRVLVRVLLLSGPAIVLAGYAADRLMRYLFVEFQVQLHPLVRSTVLFVVMWAALWLTSKDLIDELRSKSRNKENPPPPGVHEGK